jgi:uncharacterized protein YcbK (DUF882 family)
MSISAGLVLVAGPAVEGSAAAEARPADASTADRASAKGRSRARRSRGTRICTGGGKQRRCRWQPAFAGHGVGSTRLRAEPLPSATGEIVLTAVNFRETYEVDILDDQGRFDEAALAALDRGFRCRRTREHRAVDPRLYVVLSIIYDHFGKRPIELVSGFRFQRNESSRHYHAAAMDIRIEGVSIKDLYAFAESLDTGGMGIGIYPRAGFVHIDYRAPGEQSYRWTDRSGPGDESRGKKPSKRWTRQPKPTS